MLTFMFAIIPGYIKYNVSRKFDKLHSEVVYCDTQNISLSTIEFSKQE